MIKKTVFYIILSLLLGLSTVHGQEIIEHKVKKGETVSSISRKYNVSIDKILNLNPNAKYEIKENSILKIPASIKESKPIEFITHKVRSKKETLKSIAKKYNTTENLIKKYNNILYAQPLKKRMKLSIPVFKESKPIIDENKNDLPSFAMTEKNHVVKQGETEWSISHLYGIKIDELRRLNPNIENNLKVGDNLILPENTEITFINVDSKNSVDNDNFQFYEVKEEDTIYSLTRTFSVEEVKLRNLNPQLEEGLKVGMVLKLPIQTAIIDNTINAFSSENKKEEDQTVNLMGGISNGKEINLALLLPFQLQNLNGTESTLSLKDKLMTKSKSSSGLNYALDFYSGALMAIDSLQKLGGNIKVRIFDTQKDGIHTREIIRNNNFNQYDAIIGPFYTETCKAALIEANNLNIPLVSPLNRGSLPDSEYLIQTIPNKELLENGMHEYLKKVTSEDHKLIVITDFKHKASRERIIKNFPNAMVVYPQDSGDYVDTETLKGKFPKEIDPKELEEMGEMERINFLKKKEAEKIPYHVVLNTDNNSLILNVTSILNSIAVNEDITLFTTKADNNSFMSDDISNHHLAKLKFHFPSRNSEKSESYDEFVRKYMKHYYTSPNRISLKGFDTLMDIALRIAATNNLNSEISNIGPTSYLNNKFNYSKKPFGGNYNQEINILKFEGLELKNVK